MALALAAEARVQYLNTQPSFLSKSLLTATEVRSMLTLQHPMVPVT